MPDTAVSFVVPARNEQATLPATLESIRDQRTDREYEVLVVDGDSDDATPEIAAAYDATVVHQPRTGTGDGREATGESRTAAVLRSYGSEPSGANRTSPDRRSDGGDGVAPGIGDARDRGAERANGDWLAFVDADTAVRPDYVDAMLGFVREAGLAAASSRCRLVGPARAKVMEATINHAFPRLDRPVLPGFNCFVHRDAYADAGGFPDVPNEDTAFSRELGKEWPTGYHPDVLAATSARRIARSGLTGTLYHYLKLDWRRLRADY
ncbi:MULTISPECIES: glycosyltransferase family 2 protein [Halorussus]|uniref:glycosyltransferase n=1 Tax=Halorussus TaxID=1070314 RepID=UPI000E2132B8|nr:MULTISPECIES: glycosyltransferase [Halorussus]NHN59629.1 glycosyltransferase [Halorussus sp. JP-T4]